MGARSFLGRRMVARTMIASALLFGAATAGAGVANAEGEKSPWTYWLGAGGHFYEADDANESGALYEARVSYALDPNIDVEVGFGGGPFFEGNDFNAPDPKEASYNGKNSPGENWMLKSNLGGIYHFDGDPNKTWDPYASLMGGMGYLGKQRDENQNWVPFGGPGVGVSYWFNPDAAIRADYSVLAFSTHIDIDHEFLLLGFYRFGGGSEVEGSKDGKSGDQLGGSSSGPLKTVYFDFDKSNITKDSAQRLHDNADWMKSNPGKHVSLEGHCDERGTNEYNMALGQRRAKSAYDYLRNLGIPKDQMSTNSFGEEFPADPGHNEAAWSKNRRVESVLK